MGIIVDPLTKIIRIWPTPNFSSKIHFETQGYKKTGIHPLTNSKTSSITTACCIRMMYAQLYGYCNRLT